MSAFDKIIGYDKIKTELMQISDMIHRRMPMQPWARGCLKACFWMVSPASAKR